MAKFDIYQAVTDRIIEQLDNGVIPWYKPWSGIASGAYNTVSNKTYSLLNQMLLKHDGEYATYKQWSELGGQVRKDEESEIVVFWKMIPVEEKVNGEIVKKTIPYLKYINVFHVSQVDGVQPKDKNAVIHEPIKEAEKIIADYDARESITMEDVLGNNAYYAPLRDYLCVPTKEQYSDINKYYSTKFHEMVHSTGHKSRLNRFDDNTKIAPFGSEDYSKEELVAEIGSASLMSLIGIETEKTFKNNVAYIQSWLKVLKNDKRMIVSASSRAQKAVEYILNEKI